MAIASLYDGFIFRFSFLGLLFFKSFFFSSRAIYTKLRDIKGRFTRCNGRQLDGSMYLLLIYLSIFGLSSFSLSLCLQPIFSLSNLALLPSFPQETWSISCVSLFLSRLCSTPLGIETAGSRSSRFFLLLVSRGSFEDDVVEREFSVCDAVLLLFSLSRGGQDRLAFSVLWVMTPKGEILSSSFHKTFIHSRAALTYAEAQNMVDDPNDR